MPSGRTPRIYFWLPYITLGVPTAIALLAWLLLPGHDWNGWIALPLWIASYFTTRALLRRLFTTHDID